MTKKMIKEEKDATRRVFIDSSSPSTQSILRVISVFFLCVLLVVLLGAVLYWLKSLIFLLILSVFFAYLLNPLVGIIRTPFKERHLEKFMPRSLAIVIAYLFVFTILGIAISYIAPKITEQAKQLATQIPIYSENVQNWTRELTTRYQNYQIPTEIEQDLTAKLRDYLTLIGTTLTAFAGGLLLNSVLYLPWLILVPIFSFFFLKDVNAMRVSFCGFFRMEIGVRELIYFSMMLILLWRLIRALK